MKYFILLFLVLLVSCTTELKYPMNNHKFLSPESVGELGKGNISLGIQEDQKVLLASAYDDLIFSIPSNVDTSSKISKNVNISFPINVGLLERLDFYTANFKYGLKYQFYGSPEKERKSEYKAALALGYGNKNKNSGTVVTQNNNNVRNYNADIALRSYEISCLVGKRFSETLLWYLNVFRDYYSYKGALSSSQFASVYVSGKSVNQGAMLGIHYLENDKKNPFTAKAEFGLAHGKLDRQGSITYGSYGIEGGYNW